MAIPVYKLNYSVKGIVRTPSVTSSHGFVSELRIRSCGGAAISSENRPTFQIAGVRNDCNSTHQCHPDVWLSSFTGVREVEVLRGLSRSELG